MSSSRSVSGALRARAPGPSSCVELVAVHAAERRIAVVPLHLDAVGPVAEVVERRARTCRRPVSVTSCANSRRRNAGAPYGARPMTLNSSP